MSSSLFFPCGRPQSKSPAPLSNEKLESFHSQLKNYLSQKGLKYTSQRWRIFKPILQTAGHHDAGQIVLKVKAEHPTIGPATVYRSLKILQNAGLLIESHQNSQGRTVFELHGESHHDHIQCLDCGEIFEFHNSQIEQLQNEVAKQNAFTIQEHRHVIQGHCSYFQKNKS